MARRRAQVHDHVPSVHYDDEGLLGIRRASSYTPTEQEFSVLLYSRIEQLLKGERNDLLVLRKYPREPNRLGAMSTPVSLDRNGLRVQQIERMATDVLVFLSARGPGGPVAQQVTPDGRLQEIRKYPTRYPHIVIERTDTFGEADHEVPDEIQWHARRVQNHRRNLQLNNMLDMAGLGIEVAKILF